MKIPDDVYAERCRYCMHGKPGVENNEIPDDKLFIHYWAEKAPCNIIGIAQCGKVPGECLSFAPRPMFGICLYCDFDNCFTTGYCTFPGGPVNKRRVYLGHNVLDDYWREHALSTCDRYRAKSSWKDSILRNVLEGCAPANFDPDTWEPLGRIDGSAVAKRWEYLQAADQKEKEKQRKATEPAPAEDDGQTSLF